MAAGGVAVGPAATRPLCLVPSVTEHRACTLNSKKKHVVLGGDLHRAEVEGSLLRT